MSIADYLEKQKVNKKLIYGLKKLREIANRKGKKITTKFEMQKIIKSLFSDGPNFFFIKKTTDNTKNKIHKGAPI